MVSRKTIQNAWHIEHRGRSVIIVENYFGSLFCQLKLGHRKKDFSRETKDKVILSLKTLLLLMLMQNKTLKDTYY